MSEKLGPLAFEKREGPVFLGMQSQNEKDYSESTAREIDNEVRKFVNDGHEKALEILRDNIDILHNLAKALLEKETIDGEEVEMIMKGATLDDIEKIREKRREGLEAESKAREEEMKAKEAEEKARQKEKEDEDGKDPVGNPGTAPA